MADETTDTGNSKAETTTAAPVEAPAGDAPGTSTKGDEGVDPTVLGGEDGDGDDKGDEGKGNEDEPEPKADDKPVIPEKYELQAVEGVEIDEESMALADPVFRKLGLSNEGAQELMPVAAEFAKRAGAAALAAHQIEQAKSFGAMTREWAENAKGDAEIGGANWDATVQLSGKALDLLGFPKGSDFRKALNESGFGNHPEFIRAFRRIGERLSEDSFERGGTGESGKPKSDRELFYPDFSQK